MMSLRFRMFDTIFHFKNAIKKFHSFCKWCNCLENGFIDEDSDEFKHVLKKNPLQICISIRQINIATHTYTDRDNRLTRCVSHGINQTSFFFLFMRNTHTFGILCIYKNDVGKVIRFCHHNLYCFVYFVRQSVSQMILFRNGYLIRYDQIDCLFVCCVLIPFHWIALKY